MESPGDHFSPDTLAFMELAIQQVMTNVELSYAWTYSICVEDFELNGIRWEGRYSTTPIEQVVASKQMKSIIEIPVFECEVLANKATRKHF